jgi:UDP-N-acetylglucosamine diphosphorylase/glucosamine-1-phosphate N-acetyltransferase
MNPSTILLFEPSNAHTLYPFSVLHPAWELRCGALRLFEKVERQFPDARTFVYAEHERKPQYESFCERFGQKYSMQDIQQNANITGDMLVLQANVLPTMTLWQTMRRTLENMSGLSKPLVFVSHEQPFGAWIPEAAMQALQASDVPPTPHQISSLQGAFYDDAKTTHVEAHVITHLWDALKWNGDAIQDDARLFNLGAGEEISDAQGVFTINIERIALGQNVRIAPMTVLDASRGPIILEDGVDIMAQSTLIGPCAVGKYSVMKIGTKLYENTSIGEQCKVGGELKNTILQAYANKQHDGCLGYSFLSEWVNLGAGTSVSDLKNNYSRIRVRLPESSVDTSPQAAKEINTGHTSLGMLCGDHSKSGINSMFNTGTVVGVSANVFDGNYPEKFIPSFSWGGRKDSPVFELEKAIELARTVMARRNRTLTAHEEHLLRAEFQRGGRG